MSKEGKLIHNTMLIAISNICTKFVSFFMMPLYTSLLTTGEYGVVDMIATYTSLIAMGINMQLEQGVFRFLVEARGNPPKQNEYISNAVYLTIAAIAVFTLVAVPVLTVVGYAYTNYLIVSVLVNVLSALLLQIPRGCGDNKAYAAISCICGLSHVLLNVLFVAVFKWSIDGMLRAGILSHVITICLVVRQSRLWKRTSLKNLHKQSMRELLQYSLPLVPCTFMWWIVNASDRVIINLTLGVALNGVYYVANKFASIYALAGNIFHIAWTEAAVENIGDIKRSMFYQEIFNKMVRFYSSCCVGLIAIIPFVFPFLVDDKFGEAIRYIPLLLIAAMVHALTSFYGSIYLAFKQTKSVANSTFLAAALNIIINLLLIRYVGLYAAALSTLISYSIILAVRYVEIKKMTNIAISKTFLLKEIVVHILVIISFYSDNRILQVITLMWLIPYCCVSNRQLIMSAIRKLKSKLVR